MLELGLRNELLEQNLSVTHTRPPCEQGMELCWSAANSQWFQPSTSWSSALRQRTFLEFKSQNCGVHKMISTSFMFSYPSVIVFFIVLGYFIIWQLDGLTTYIKTEGR